MSLADVRRIVLVAEAVLLSVVVAAVLLRGGGSDDGRDARAVAARTTAPPDAKRAADDASEVIKESERPPGEEATDVGPAAEDTSGPLTLPPMLPTSTVVRSGVSSSKGFLQVSLVATDDRSPEQVLAAYRRMLGDRGFVESSVPAVGGSTAAGFAHGAEHLTVTTTPDGRRTKYSLLGRLRVSG
ncbi:hypothetical protein [Aeromicrobium wangtongii]|uniref:hypothetical protein n=1 Tax=Aeromicrobium wangtongii TaxID=2969247 RepID=UPI00201837D5|nr:hypothetical protein [Aeromicrobium wangtongii]MCL3817838.1 hypothetical protein [Aeromicrobium wangtongii]